MNAGVFLNANLQLLIRHWLRCRCDRFLRAFKQLIKLGKKMVVHAKFVWSVSGDIKFLIVAAQLRY